MLCDMDVETRMNVGSFLLTTISNTTINPAILNFVVHWENAVAEE